MWKVAIVDDEKEIAAQLEQALLEVCRELNLEVEMDVLLSGTEVIRSMDHHHLYHMIFLDIEMGECNGIDVGRYIRETLQDEATQLIFVSGKNGYDRQLFEFRPFAFLEKPVEKNRLSEVLSKYIRIYGKRQKLFEYKSGHSTYWVRLEEILFFESDDRKVKLKTMTEEKVFYGSVQKIFEQLNDKGFFMPHNAFVVNYRFVKAFQPDGILLVNGDRIPIAKGKRKEIVRFQLLMENGGGVHV